MESLIRIGDGRHHNRSRVWGAPLVPLYGHGITVYNYTIITGYGKNGIRDTRHPGTPPR